MTEIMPVPKELDFTVLPAGTPATDLSAAQTLGQRQRPLEWSQKVADCCQSGLSVKRGCSENGASVKT